MTTSEFEADVLAAVERFVERDVMPHVAALERDQTYPEAIVEQMKELGLFGLAVPAEHGGLGLSLPVFAKVMMVLSRGWTSLAAYVNSHSTVAYAIGTHGTDAQRAHYLPLMATGAVRGALCLTEAHAGSDLQAIRSRAVATADGFRLSGEKIYVTNGGRANLFLFLAKTDPAANPPKRGLSLLLVDKDREGITLASTFHKMAYGLVDTVELLFDEVSLPADAVLGGLQGRGMNHLLDALEVGRIAIGASAVGLAASALTHAREFARNRRTFGVTIDQHQAVQLRLAEMATQLVTARLLVEEAARVKEAGGRADMLSGMAKLQASEACLAIVSDALRIHGGHGYIKEYPIERLFREAPLYIVGEGTNDIQKLVIARRLLEGADDHLLAP